MPRRSTLKNVKKISTLKCFLYTFFLTTSFTTMSRNANHANHANNASDNQQWAVTRDFVVAVQQNSLIVFAKHFRIGQRFSDVNASNRAPVIRRCVRASDTANQQLVNQWGIFASDPISKGAFICFYFGSDTPIADVQDPESDRAMQYDERVVVANSININNIAQFVNDSSIGGSYDHDGPSENVLAMCFPVTKCTAIVALLAKSNIRKGEQLLLKYGTAYWENRAKQGDAIYIPAEILSEKTVNGKRIFQVRWKYFNDVTKEPLENIQRTETFVNYEKQRKARSKKRKNKVKWRL